VVDSASNRNEYEETSWGVKDDRRIRLTTSPLSVRRLPRKCGGLDVSQPMGLHRLLQSPRTIISVNNTKRFIFGFGTEGSWPHLCFPFVNCATFPAYSHFSTLLNTASFLSLLLLVLSGLTFRPKSEPDSSIAVRSATCLLLGGLAYSSTLKMTNIPPKRLIGVFSVLFQKRDYLY
jgi:hypothetical protein